MLQWKLGAVMKQLAYTGMFFAAPYTASLAGQDSSHADVSPRSWFRIGVGRTSAYLFVGGSVLFRLNHPWGIGVRGGVTSEVELFRQPSEVFWEISPSLAYVPFVRSHGMIALLVGAGAIGGTQRGGFLGRHALATEEYEKVTFRTLCMTAELQATWFITRGLGISAAVFTNVNKERSFSGYHIGLQFTQP
jgi:hypothetical protein